MFKYVDDLTDRQGNAIVGASIAVVAYPGNTAVTIYSDDGVTAIANSTVTTDVNGTFQFYAPAGRYNFTETLAGVTLGTRTDVQIFSDSTISIWSGTAGGTANALTLTPSPSIASYQTGQTFKFKSSATANTAATTIAISGLATKAVQRNGVALIGGEIAASQWYEVLYDGAAFQLSAVGSDIFQPSGAGAVARTVQTELNGKRIENIADLRNFAGVSTGDVAHVTSYYSGWAALAEGPTGGGFFVWDGASTATHNGGTIISLNAGGTGRWKRPDQRNITIRQFGAKGDGTDFTTIFQTALNSNTSGVDLYFEPGDYLLSGAVTDITYDNTTIRGAGGKLSKIFVTAPNASIPVMLRAQGATVRRKNINIDGLYFHGGGTVRIFAYTGAIQFTNTQDSSVRNCYFEKMSAVVVFFGRYATDNTKFSDNIDISGNTIRDSYSDGFYGQVFYNSRITNNFAYNVGTDGENMPYLFEGIYRVVIANNVSEGSPGTGLIVNNMTSATPVADSVVVGNVIKGSGVYGIFSVGAMGVTITGNAVSDTGTLSDRHGIMVHTATESTSAVPLGTRTSNTISGNTIERSGGAGIAISNSMNVVIGNTLRDNNTANGAGIGGIHLFNNAGGTTFPHYNHIANNFIANTLLNEGALVNGNTKYAVVIPVSAKWNRVLNNSAYNMRTGLISDAGTETTRRGNSHVTDGAYSINRQLSGRAVLVAGTVTVSTEQVEAADNIILSRVVTGGTQGTLSVGTITAATSFVINSSNAADTSTIYWEIVH